MVGALEGIRVLDFTIWLFGPSCTQVLGDFGAEVIKVEPSGGEPGREMGRGPISLGGISTGYMSRNRNKKSICIDLRKPEAKEIVRRLVKTCDVAIQNFRPGVAERLGLTYEEFSQINPRLIYVVGSGYGPTGPYQNRGGQDRAAQAMSGLMSVTGDPQGPPVAMGQPIIDFLGGMLLTQGVLLALRARDIIGMGQRVDVSLLDSAIVAGIQACTHYLNTGESLSRRLRPLMEVYKTQDGYLQLITVFVRGGNPLSLVCSALGIQDLFQDGRFDSPEKQEQNAEELGAILSETFVQRPTTEWLRRLEEKDIICAPVYNYGEVFEDPQVQHNKMVMEIDHQDIGKLKLVAPPVKLSQTPGWVHCPPPNLGQHTDEVLADLGFSPQEVASFRAGDIVA